MKVLLDMQQEVRARITSELTEAKWVALTFDFWTSLAIDSYLGVTVHFIAPNWTLETRLLQTREVASSHTGVYL